MAFIAAHRTRLVRGELLAGVDRERGEGDRRESDARVVELRVEADHPHAGDATDAS
ncbi:hypothetical protein [Streptomyces sp. NPDC056227]|uniref:hypothetical protein n=1 Tax=Streptomyces sp. NPDC056227 TaxID=3345753 RepID=UPI0035DAAD2B